MSIDTSCLTFIKPIGEDGDPQGEKIIYLWKNSKSYKSF